MTAVALGIVVGLVLGLTGAGGSILAVPLLMVGLGMDLTQATPIALLAVFGATAFGALVAFRKGQVCPRAALMIGVAGSVATPLGVHLASRASQQTMYLAFAAVMLIVASRMFWQTVARSAATAGAGGKGSEGAICKRDPLSGRLAWTSPCAIVLGLSGIGTGILSGALGIGAGFVIVPSLRGATSLSMESVVATSLLAIAIISGGAVASHFLHGYRLSWPVAVPFLGGALLGAWAGRVLTARISGMRLQQTFAVLMVAAAFVMARRAV